MDGDVSRRALGSWAQSNFDQTVRENLGISTDARLPASERFVSGVVSLVRRRMALTHGTPDVEQPALFLLQPSVRNLEPEYRTRREPLLDRGLIPVNGRIWFVSAVVVVGEFVEIGQMDDNALFSFVTETLKLGQVPAVLFDPRGGLPEIRYYEQGLGDPNTCERILISGADISVDRIFQVIDHIYSEHLVTPDAQLLSVGKLWENPQRGVPVEQAEEMIQLHLLIGLQQAFRGCKVRVEEKDTTGRLDLELEEQDWVDPTRFIRHAVLELKVLRSRGSTERTVSSTKTKEWVLSGVKQAAAYKAKRNAIATALCCFDMRDADTGNECFVEVTELAEQLGVRLERWYLYSSAARYREVITRQMQQATLL